jgi:UDP-N-acetylglucosamine--N-acetylmuramyl-(pentapeptide) pyrophosphoryl-undecaprenol N-acetylglucosamine transferase
VRVWFAGGGTGGHLYPAIGIARALVALRRDVQPFFIGARRGVERDVLPKTGFPHVLLDLHPLYRSAPHRNWRTIAGGVRAWRELGGIAAGDPPRVVVATGGYASGLALLYAVLKRVPIVVQEQNSVAGITTRFFSRYARQIHVGFPEAAGQLRAGQGAIVRDSGNPIEPPPEVSADERRRARESWGLSGSGVRTLLVFGGSQGARAVNSVIAGFVRGGLPPRTQLLWVTGPGEHEQYATLEGESVRVVPYVPEMTRAYAAADLAVARAGAMSTAELCAWGIPMVLVPLPTAAADHQTTNALALERAGAAVVIRQKDLTADALRAAVARLFGDGRHLQAMSDAAKARARPAAAAQIARDIASLLPAQ